MKIALVTGPGGAGGTTISALTAIALARSGSATALISSDMSMPAVLGEPAIAARPGLTVLRPDPAARAIDAWPSISGYLSALGVDQDIEPSDLAGLPGAIAVSTLLEIAAAAGAGDYDTVVVDAGSSAVELLAAPESIGNLIDRLLPTPLRILRQLGGLCAGRPGQSGDAGPVDLIGQLLARLVLAHALLTDPAVTSVQLVVGPERLRSASAARMLPTLAVCGAGTGRVVLNRRGLLTDRELADQAAYWPAELLVVPEQPTEPVGPALDALVDTLDLIAEPLPAGIGPAVAELEVSRQGNGFLAKIPVPLAERAALHLARSGDDVLITVAGHTRRIELPSVLQRCTIVGAEFIGAGGAGSPGAGGAGSPGAALLVRFVPDPGRWPQELAAFATAGAAAGAAGSAGAAARGAAT